MLSGTRRVSKYSSKNWLKQRHKPHLFVKLFSYCCCCCCVGPNTFALTVGNQHNLQVITRPGQGTTRRPAVSRGQPAVSRGQPAVSRGQPAVSRGRPAVAREQPAVSRGYPNV